MFVGSMFNIPLEESFNEEATTPFPLLQKCMREIEIRGGQTGLCLNRLKADIKLLNGYKTTMLQYWKLCLNWQLAFPYWFVSGEDLFTIYRSSGENLAPVTDLLISGLI